MAGFEQGFLTTSESDLFWHQTWFCIDNIIHPAKVFVCPICICRSFTIHKQADRVIVCLLANFVMAAARYPLDWAFPFILSSRLLRFISWFCSAHLVLCTGMVFLKANYSFVNFNKFHPCIKLVDCKNFMTPSWSLDDTARPPPDMQSYGIISECDDIVLCIGTRGQVKLTHCCPHQTLILRQAQYTTLSLRPPTPPNLPCGRSKKLRQM